MITDPGNGINNVEERLAALTARVDTLERKLAHILNLPDECREESCDYYEHYLPAGPAEITHAEYHALERRHAEVVDKLCAVPPGQRGPSGLEHLADLYERRLRA